MYLLYTTSFVTLEEIRNYKSLQSYKYFTSGWVIDVKWKMINDGMSTASIGKVRHSYSSKEPLKPWILIKSSGSVVCGHCTCMAGQGDTYSHVGAVLYWLETRVRIREQTSCTSKENTWIMPMAVKNIPYLKLEQIDFVTAEKKIKLCENATAPETSSFQFAPPTNSELSLFFEEIAKETKNKPAILSIISPYNNQFTQSL